MSGPEIISNTGKVIWFHRLPSHELAADFRTQTYQGKPVLTWWQGPPDLGAISGGTDYIYNDRYRRIAEVKGGQRLFGRRPGIPHHALEHGADHRRHHHDREPDLHRRLRQPEIVDSIVQEIDITTGKVLFQWNAADHVPYQDSEQPRPPSAATPWDWFYMNAINRTATATCWSSARDTWTLYEVNLQTGDIIWQVGGKAQHLHAQGGARGRSSTDAGEMFAYQHDPEPLGNDEYTVFDDESAGGTGMHPYSRVVTVRRIGDQGGYPGEVGQAARGAAGHRRGERADHPQRRLVRRLGRRALHLRVQPVRTVAVQRPVPGVDTSYRAYRLPWHPAHLSG